VSIQQDPSPTKVSGEGRWSGGRTLRTVVTAEQIERARRSVLEEERREREREEGGRQRSLREYLWRGDDSVGGARTEDLAMGGLEGEELDLEGEEDVPEEGGDEVEDADEIDETNGEDEDIIEAERAGASDDEIEDTEMTQQTPSTPVEDQSDLIELLGPSHTQLCPSKSDRSLFKSRPRNTVHNLHLTVHVTLSSIFIQHKALHPPTPSPHASSTPEKEYALPSEKAEERLSLTISKDDFVRMRVVGQFNLGFIITILERGDTADLFIVDQHASDEKYNFERLQTETVISSQVLAR
jgi:DNA mismatch repair protein PMS2